MNMTCIYISPKKGKTCSTPTKFELCKKHKNANKKLIYNILEAKNKIEKLLEFTFRSVDEFENKNYYVSIVEQLLNRVSTESKKVKKAKIAWCIFYFLSIHKDWYIGCSRFQNTMLEKLEEFKELNLFFGYLVGIDQDGKKTEFEDITNEYFIKATFGPLISSEVQLNKFQQFINTFGDKELTINYYSRKLHISAFNHSYNSFVSSILYFDIETLILRYSEQKSKRKDFSINRKQLIYYGSSQDIVNYILKSFPNAEISAIDSSFYCKNRKIKYLHIERYINSYKGCTIETFGPRNFLNQFAGASCVPPQYVYTDRDENDHIDYILKYKFFILYLLNNDVSLISSPLADPSLFQYINEMIPYID